MRVRMIRTGARRNRDFDSSQPKDRETNWPTVVVPAGEEIEHPDAWMLCLATSFEPPLAEPVDDEAREAVAQAVARRARAEADRELRRQAEEAEAQKTQKGRARRSGAEVL